MSSRPDSPSPSPPSYAPSPALPEFPQPRLGALLHSPQSLHLAQQPAQVLGAPAAVVGAQRRHLQGGGTISSESSRKGQPSRHLHPGLLVPEGRPHLAPHTFQ